MNKFGKVASRVAFMAVVALGAVAVGNRIGVVRRFINNVSA